MTKRWIAALVAAITAAVGLGAITAVGAQTAEENPTIYACKDNDRGNIYIVDGADVLCEPGETLIEWNKKGDKGDQGDQGDQGDKGDQGDQGDQGDKGAPGISGLQYVLGSFVPVPNNSTKSGTATATCPSGKVVVGGSSQVGGSATDRFEKVNIDGGIPVAPSAVTTPVTDGTATAWTVTGSSPGIGNPYQFRAIAICAFVNP